MGVYIDDILVIEITQKDIDEIKRGLIGEFKMSDLGPVNWYLGSKITCDILAGKMFLSQASYIEKILERFGMQQATDINTLIVKQHALVYASKDY